MSDPTVLTVGAGQRYQTIAAAITEADHTSGAVMIQVTAGTYVDDGGTITNDDVTIEGVGGVAKLVGASDGTGGTAAIVMSGNNDKLANLDISGVSTGAGVVVKAGMAELDTVHVHDNQTGIAATAQVRLLYSDVGFNDTNIDVDLGLNANNHAMSAADSAYLGYSYIHDAQGGSEIKSSAQTTVVDHDLIYDNTSASAYEIDAAGGFQLDIGYTVIEKGALSTTDSMIGSSPHSLQFNNDVALVNDKFPTTATVYDQMPWYLDFEQGANITTWDMPNAAGVLLNPAADTIRPSIDQLPQSLASAQATPTFSTVTGNRDGSVTIAGRFDAGDTVFLADTVKGQTTLLGSAVADAKGHFLLTTGFKIDTSTLNAFTASGTNGAGFAVTTAGALILTDTGTDHLISAPDASNVFAVMSFRGSDVIDGFKTTYAGGATHDVLNFSGRGVTNFSQVQSMLSGSTSTVITMAGGKTVTLDGVRPTTLSSSDFVYS